MDPDIGVESWIVRVSEASVVPVLSASPDQPPGGSVDPASAAIRSDDSSGSGSVSPGPPPPNRRRARRFIFDSPPSSAASAPTASADSSVPVVSSGPSCFGSAAFVGVAFRLSAGPLRVGRPTW